MAWNEGSKRSKERTEEILKSLEEKVSSLESNLQHKSQEIAELQELLNQDTDSTKKALANASRMASTYKNRIASADEEVKLKVNEIDDFMSLLKQTCEESDAKLNHLKELEREVIETSTAMDDKFNALASRVSSSSKLIEDTNLVLENAKNTSALVDKLENRVLLVEDMNSKSEALYQTFSKRKNEIDEFYYKYMGQEGDVGIAENVKKEAQELIDNYEKLQQNLAVLEDETEEKIKTFLTDSEKRAEQFFSKSDVEKVEILKEIKKLLPSALTAGLSSAYEEKVKNEVESQSSMSKVFYTSVIGLLVISALPFVVANIANSGINLKVILNESLDLLPLMIPMYLPIVWVAYSTNKRINLSKRLIEEYTHKGVLNKTFKGLSDQIDAIGDSDLTEELRTKLLFNLLSASSENPGKLISDYNSSDHPLMDALEKSAKLANSIEVLSKIPGFSKIVTKLDEKSKKILETQEQRVSAVLEGDENDGKSTQ